MPKQLKGEASPTDYLYLEGYNSENQTFTLFDGTVVGLTIYPGIAEFIFTIEGQEFTYPAGAMQLYFGASFQDLFNTFRYMQTIEQLRDYLSEVREIMDEPAET